MQGALQKTFQVIARLIEYQNEAKHHFSKGLDLPQVKRT